MSFVSKYHEVADLHVRAAALTYGDGPNPRIEIGEQLQNLASFACPEQGMAELLPVYNGGEELSGLYHVGEAEQGTLFWPAASLIAFVALQEGAAGRFDEREPALRQFLTEYGSDAAKLLCDLALEAANSAAPQYRRCKVSDGIITKYAAMDTDDPDFCESSFVECGATDICATLVTWMEFDADLYCELLDMLERKSAAAVRASRALLEPA